MLDAGYTHHARYNVVPGWEIGLEEHTYAELTAANKAAWRGSPAQPGMPIVTAGWDRRPWENLADPNQIFRCHIRDEHLGHDKALMPKWCQDLHAIYGHEIDSMRVWCQYCRCLIWHQPSEQGRKTPCLWDVKNN